MNIWIIIYLNSERKIQRHERSSSVWIFSYHLLISILATMSASSFLVGASENWNLLAHWSSVFFFFPALIYCTINTDIMGLNPAQAWIFLNLFLSHICLSCILNKNDPLLLVCFLSNFGKEYEKRCLHLPDPKRKDWLAIVYNEQYIFLLQFKCVLFIYLI